MSSHLLIDGYDTSEGMPDILDQTVATYPTLILGIAKLHPVDLLVAVSIMGHHTMYSRLEMESRTAL